MIHGSHTALGTAVGIWCATIVYHDLAAKSLPNWLTLGGGLTILVLKGCFWGFSTALGALLAGGVAGAFFLAPFFLHAAGGGDVKLLFAMGVLAGWPRALAALFWISVLGFVFGVIFLLRSVAVRKRLRHWLMVLCNPSYDRKAGREALGESDKLRMSFGTPIVMGTLMAYAIPL